MLVGKVRAKQYYSDDADRGRNLGVLLHGDGAFAGQGVVYETLDMSALPDYTVGGCIHLIVNNQARAPGAHASDCPHERPLRRACSLTSKDCPHSRVWLQPIALENDSALLAHACSAL